MNKLLVTNSNNDAVRTARFPKLSKKQKLNMKLLVLNRFIHRRWHIHVHDQNGRLLIPNGLQ